MQYEYITYLLMKKENIFRALIKNKSGIISKLDDLEECGKKSLFVCVHLLLQEGDVSKNKNRDKTFQFLEKNKNIRVNHCKQSTENRKKKVKKNYTTETITFKRRKKNWSFS